MINMEHIKWRCHGTARVKNLWKNLWKFESTHPEIPSISGGVLDSVTSNRIQQPRFNNPNESEKLPSRCFFCIYFEQVRTKKNRNPFKMSSKLLLFQTRRRDNVHLLEMKSHKKEVWKDFFAKDWLMLPGSLHGERFRRFLKNRKAFKRHKNYQPQLVSRISSIYSMDLHRKNQLATWGYRPILQRGFQEYGTLIMEASWTPQNMQKIAGWLILLRNPALVNRLFYLWMAGFLHIRGGVEFLPSTAATKSPLRECPQHALAFFHFLLGQFPTRIKHALCFYLVGSLIPCEPAHGHVWL